MDGNRGWSWENGGEGSNVGLGLGYDDRRDLSASASRWSMLVTGSNGPLSRDPILVSFLLYNTGL